MNETTYGLLGYFGPRRRDSEKTVFDLDIITSDAGTVFRVMRIDEPGESTGQFIDVKEAGTVLETLQAIAQAAKDVQEQQATVAHE
jgi:hypothetical protein